MFYIETKEQNLDIISDIQIGITFLIFTLEQICNHGFKGISKLIPVVGLGLIVLDNNRLTTLSPLLFRDTPYTTAVELSGNRFECDCRLMWLRSSTKVNQRYIKAVCFSPPSVAGTNVLSYDTSLYCVDTTETGIV